MNRSHTTSKFKALSTAGLLAIGGALGGISMLGCDQDPEPSTPPPPPQQPQPEDTPNPNVPPPPQPGEPSGTGGQNPQ